MAKTVEQRTNLDGFPKPGELIEIYGAHGLEATDRAILNLLYQFAHDSGNIADREAEWEIPLSRLRSVKHRSNERVRDSLERLKRIEVSIPYQDHKTGEERILITDLFEFFDISADEADGKATVRFGLPRKLRPIIARSARWGRIKTEVVCEMTSKYAIALYELLALRSKMDRCVEVFPIDRFRDMMGVPPGKLLEGKNLVARVIEPAVLEVNGLSDLGVKVELRRRSPRAPIDSVVIAWWEQEGDAFRAALRERERSKIGRMARLRGTVEAMSVSEVVE